MSQTPLLSVCCITYNHVDFIKDALEGFVMQKTTFPFEVLIHDDASTDGTSDIIREYQKRYPQLINPIIQEENQWSQGKRGMNLRFNIPRSQGKYMALCEGDDYWTDPLKLQKQVEFLEGNPDFSFCFHDSYILDEKTNQKDIAIGTRKVDQVVDLKSCILQHNAHTASIVFRKTSYSKPIIKTPKGDYALVITLASSGFGRYIPEVMSVYRRHLGGVWSPKSRINALKENVEFYNSLLDAFQDDEIRQIVSAKKKYTLRDIGLFKMRQGAIFEGLNQVIRHWDFNTDKRLKTSIKKVMNAGLEGLGLKR